MDFATRAAGADFAHGPEVVLVAQAQDSIVAHAGHFLPQQARFLVAVMHGVHQALGVDGVVLDQEFVGEMDRIGLEVVAEGKVAQHLEEGVVPGRATDVLQVVVLAPGAHTLLRAAGARARPLRLAGKDVLELVHPSVGEEQGRVVGRHQRRAGDLLMAMGHEGVEKLAANFVRDPVWHGPCRLA